MAIRPDCIQKPANPVPRGYRPPESDEYRVRDGESWETIAKAFEIGAWDLIAFNYPGLSRDMRTAPKEVEEVTDLRLSAGVWVAASPAGRRVPALPPAAGPGPAPRPGSG
jgi:hypothetical protein